MVVFESTSGRPGAADASIDRPRASGATVWAAIAIVWLVIAVQALVHWLFSPDFAPAPLLGPDLMPLWNMVGLRIFEGLSVVVLVCMVWLCVVGIVCNRRALGSRLCAFASNRAWLRIDYISVYSLCFYGWVSP